MFYECWLFSEWCEQSFGFELVAKEILCRAKGDKHCRFIMAQPHKIEGFIEDYFNKHPELKNEINPQLSRKKDNTDLIQSAGVGLVITGEKNNITFMNNVA